MWTLYRMTKDQIIENLTAIIVSLKATIADLKAAIEDLRAQLAEAKELLAAEREKNRAETAKLLKIIEALNHRIDELWMTISNGDNNMLRPSSKR